MQCSNAVHQLTAARATICQLSVQVPKACFDSAHHAKEHRFSPRFTGGSETLRGGRMPCCSDLWFEQVHDNSLAAECCLTSSEIEMQRRTHCDVRNWESSHVCVCVCAKHQHFGFFLPNILRLHICEFCVYYMCILYAIIGEDLGWQQPWPGFNPQNEILGVMKNTDSSAAGHRRSSFVKPGMKNCSPLKDGSGLLFERHLWQLLGGTVLDFNKNCGCTWHRLFATNDITWFIMIYWRHKTILFFQEPIVQPTTACFDSVLLRHAHSKP